MPEPDVSCRERVEVRFPLARESPDRYVSNDSPQLLLEIAQRLFFLLGKRIAGLGGHFQLLELRDVSVSSRQIGLFERSRLGSCGRESQQDD